MDYLNGITCGDCVTLMKQLPPECVDLTITSPPYDQLRDYHGFNFDFPSIAAELFRITKPGGVVVWIVNDQTVNGSETGTSFRHALGFLDTGFRLHDTMIYHKPGCPFPGSNRYYPSFEFMFLATKGKPKTTNLIRDRKNKYPGAVPAKTERMPDGTLKKRKKFIIPEFGLRQNIWTYSPGSCKTAPDNLWVGHPGVMPLQLAKDHVMSWSNPGDVIFDPMVGSGQTCIAALLLQRQWFGFDVSAEYCELSRKRIAHYSISVGDC